MQLIMTPSISLPLTNIPKYARNMEYSLELLYISSSNRDLNEIRIETKLKDFKTHHIFKVAVPRFFGEC
jgi:hypothetical protein